MMKKDQFVYVTYIRTTPEKLWKALTEPEFTRKFWCNTAQESEWKPGSSWKIVAPDGMLTDSGEVLEIEPLRLLVLKWRNEFRPELKAEGYSRLTYQLEPEGKSVKLTVIHEIEKEGSKFIEAVSSGWPHILASLKSLLETGESLEETRFESPSDSSFPGVLAEEIALRRAMNHECGALASRLAVSWAKMDRLLPKMAVRLDRCQRQLAKTQGSSLTKALRTRRGDRSTFDQCGL
jgi:uncharacterized protein YndB with AHSA1/START domain